MALFHTRSLCMRPERGPWTQGPYAPADLSQLVFARPYPLPISTIPIRFSASLKVTSNAVGARPVMASGPW